MKICITSKGDNVAEDVDPRFGRCAYFVIYDTDTKDVEIIKNPNQDGHGGAGIQSAQLLIEKGVNQLFTGKVGPNADIALKKGNIKIISDTAGIVSAVIETL